jgi:hypothetical protein
MPNIQFHFVAISKITMRHEMGAPASQINHTDIRLDVSKNLNKATYLDQEGLPTKEAIKPISLAFLQGIITNIQLGHEKGWWKEADHMRYVIDELQRAFVHPTNGLEVTRMEY